MKRNQYLLGHDTAPEKLNSGIVLINKDGTSYEVKYKCCGFTRSINAKIFSRINNTNPEVRCTKCFNSHPHARVSRPKENSYNQLVDRLVTKSWVVACE